ncbi:MAG: methyltransferase domain-containing protein [Anaerolineales bacterium]|nr:methyltransferase domain-containing protein [Anaerolineales bacterium]MCB8936771.1 methyltransferase domain-containing protein [Ardenticatenaceae bacterium]
MNEPEFLAATTQDDLLWRQLKSIPAFRAILRAVEARFYFGVELPGPTLDVGCGDGHFSQMVFQRKIEAGIDPWWNPLTKGQKSGMYDLALQAMGDKLPFPDGHFASAFSNSVLEHIPDIQPVLNETNRVMQMNGRFLITMPSHHFTQNLGGATFLARLGLPGLADAYRRFFNRIARHAHTDSAEVWAERLAAAGFSIERWQYYFSKKALWALEWGHIQGLPSAIMHAITGHWIVAPWESSLRRTERWLRPFYDEPFPEDGTCLLIVARKQANGPIPVQLPPARPFTIEELETAVASHQPIATEPEPTSEPEPQTDDLLPAVSPQPQEEPAAKPATANWFSIALGILSLLAAMMGQLALTGDPPNLASGRRWFFYSALPLLLLLWRSRPAGLGAAQSWRLPSLGQIPRRRWLFPLGLLLAILAQSAVGVPGSERPLLSILLWLAGIGLSFYAWQDAQPDAPPLIISRRTLGTAVFLFLVALVVRLVNLSHNPFMLNGIEASLGLNSLQIIRGQLQNPFATAWLTNPTLPLYFMALPISILGPTTLAVRLVSPFVGAATVAATYLFGKRLFGNMAGLLAAILLLGSHFHLHYSRLGMTNIWDGLLMLLALGAIGVAWQRPSTAPHQRTIWLWAGGLVGLNAYAFTSSRVLPVVLIAWFVLSLLLDWKSFRAQGWHLLAALGMTLVVALPLLLFYNNNPTIFMERANALGILPGQTNWLAGEAARTGMSQTAVLWQQFWQSALAFNGIPDNSPAYRPLIPLLTFGPAVLMVLGFFLALFRVRQNNHRLLLLWPLGTIIVAGMLLIESPQSHRLVVATPALALLAAIALVTLGNLLLATAHATDETPPTLNEWQPTTGNWRSHTVHAGLILVALVLIFSLNDLAFYYGRFPTNNQFADTNTEIAYEMANYLNNLDGDWTAYLYGPPILYVDFPTLPYLLTDFQAGANLFNVDSPESERAPAPTANQIFIFLPQRQAELVAVEQAFPGGTSQQVNGRYAAPLFTVYQYQP